MVTNGNDEKYWFEKEKPAEVNSSAEQSATAASSTEQPATGIAANSAAENSAAENSASENSAARSETAFSAVTSDNTDDLFGFAENSAPNASPAQGFTPNTASNAAPNAAFRNDAYSGQYSAQTDKHENHYRSEFAARAGISSGELNKSGGIKAVRGRVLKKLLKYDFKEEFKYLWIFYAVLIGTAILSAALYVASNSLSNQDSRLWLTKLTIAIYSLYSMCSGFLTFAAMIIVLTRFSRNLFSSEGYLTLSVPATAEEHIFSKVISGFVVVLLTVIVSFIGAAIVSSASGMVAMNVDLFSFLKLWGQSLEEYSTAEGVILGIEEALLLLVAEVFALQFFFSCICVGQLISPKHRIAASIGIYFGAVCVLSILFSFFLIDALVYGEWVINLNVHVGVWLIIAVLAGLNVGAFFLQRYILKHRINLS